MKKSFTEFWWRGPYKDSLRSSYPEDKTTAIKSTFSFEGNVTKSFEEKGIKTIIIDDAVEHKTVTDNTRRLVENELCAFRNQAYAASLGGLGATAYSIFKIADGYVTFGALSTLLSVGFTTVSVKSALEANTELSKWTSQEVNICNIRKNYTTNFNEGLQNKWKGKYFTPDEIKTVYYKNVTRLNEEFDEQSKNPASMEKYIERFFKENPFTKTAVDYAFDTQNKINDPSNANSHTWDRKELDSMVIKSSKISNSYQKLLQGFENSLKDIYKQDRNDKKVIEGTSILASRLVDYSKKEALQNHKTERDKELFELEKNKAQLGGEYYQRKQEIEKLYKLNPEVKAIKAKNKQNQANVDLAKKFGDSVSDQNTQFSRSTLFAAKRDQVINEFSSPVKELLDDFIKQSSGRQ